MIGKLSFCAAVSGLLVVACGSKDSPPDLAGTGGSSVGGAPSGGSTPTSGGATSTGGTTANTGGAGTTGGVATTGGAGTTGGSTPGGAPTVTCQQAASAYTIATVQLDAALVPHVVTSGWGASLFAQVPVAVNATSGDVYVGFTRD